MLGALQRSRGEQQRLVQDAGHELRTPLTSLRTNLAVLRRHPDMAAEMQERILEDLDGEVGELTDLVNELVAVASGELADQPPQDLVLADVARRVAERVGRRRSRAVVVEVLDTATVFAPLAGIERAITNLVENAVKFDQSEGEIRVVVDGGAINVIDNGPGIPQEDLSLVFDRFHRATASRALPGSGLGLAIVREIVERHGGTVNATNLAGGGASVGFALPVSGGALAPPPC
jgi:two-component system sensor histidine kinase MprB